MVHTTLSDRRKGARYAVRVPIRVRDIGIGSTVDISSSGVAFVIDVELQLGVPIGFQLTMNESAEPVDLQCGGTVVRVQRQGALVLTAATIDNLTVIGASDTGH